MLLLNVCPGNGRAITVPSTTVLDSDHRKFEKASLTNTEIQRTHRGSSKIISKDCKTGYKEI